MDINQITDKIYYVGVNDRATRRFEGLWPLPYGVTYNSYIVRGSEATVLIDSVETDEFATLLDNMKQMGVEAPDYLVVHHMEPDHSGSIPLIAERFPQMKIVCNRQAMMQIGGFYGLTAPERFHIVSDGDELSLGDTSLRFVMTPMVHWPETMMSYCASERVLFSGDAFGCFGALDGAPLDEQIADTSVYISEMYRYYSNIVGKYGKFVQAALKKTSGLAIEYLCSTHGPVWHKQMAEVIGIYDRLSRYESEEGVVIVYASMYGNTKRLVEAMAEGLARRGVKNVHVFNAAEAEQSDMIAAAFRYGTLIVGSPTYSMTVFPPVDTFVKALATREVKGKRVGLFGSYTWTPAAMSQLLDAFNAMGMPASAQMTMKQGFGEEAARALETFLDDLLK